MPIQLGSATTVSSGDAQTVVNVDWPGREADELGEGTQQLDDEAVAFNVKDQSLPKRPWILPILNRKQMPYMLLRTGPLKGSFLA